MGAWVFEGTSRNQALLLGHLRTSYGVFAMSRCFEVVEMALEPLRRHFRETLEAKASAERLRDCAERAESGSELLPSRSLVSTRDV